MTPDERITELEIRIAHMEASLEQLTQSSLAMEKVIEEQRLTIKDLQRQVRGLTPSNIASQSEETPPPHY
ncbi:MAG: SlyX family protein [Gammaproteobacteria bacterium]|jgi:SlyX protein|nr:SlyX family protein [Gammaproteobacteria bacterium]